MAEVRFQIGKAGVTDGVIHLLESALKNHKSIKIALLKSSKRDKNTKTIIADEILSKLKTPCNYRIIGFTIALRKKSTSKKL